MLPADGGEKLRLGTGGLPGRQAGAPPAALPTATPAHPEAPQEGSCTPTRLRQATLRPTVSRGCPAATPFREGAILAAHDWQRGNVRRAASAQPVCAGRGGGRRPWERRPDSGNSECSQGSQWVPFCPREEPTSHSDSQSPSSTLMPCSTWAAGQAAQDTGRGRQTPRTNSWAPAGLPQALRLGAQGALQTWGLPARHVNLDGRNSPPTDRASRCPLTSSPSEQSRQTQPSYRRGPGVPCQETVLGVTGDSAALGTTKGPRQCRMWGGDGTDQTND